QWARVVGDTDSQFVGRRVARGVVQIPKVHFDRRFVCPSASGDLGLELPGVWILAMDLKPLSGSVEHHASGTIADGRSDAIEGFEKVGLRNSELVLRFLRHDLLPAGNFAFSKRAETWNVATWKTAWFSWKATATSGVFVAFRIISTSSIAFRGTRKSPRSLL